jgi:hypothetical protein
MQCPDCGMSYLRRLYRHGFMQRVIFPLIGLYPWECPICRKPIYLRKRH